MTATALAAALPFTTACQLLGSDGDSTETGGAETHVELAPLKAMLEESRQLLAEVVDSQGRLIRDCMVEAGHEVHDEFELLIWDFGKMLLPDVEAGPMSWLHDREIAEVWGFGIWTSWNEMYGSEEHLEFESLVFDDEVASFATTDNTEFERLSKEEQFAWFVDYYGEERARMDQGHLIGEFTMGPGGLIGTVEPEGCMGEVVDELGLEATFMPQPDFGEEVGTWSTFPPPPGVDLFTSPEMQERFREARTSEDGFLDCVEEAGWGRWDFNQEGNLNARYFIELAYGSMPDPSFPGPEVFSEGVPEEVPTDVPTDTAGRQEWESGFAMDLWACVDESGLEADSERAWAQTYGTELMALEEEMYAWQEDMRDLILDAQNLLGA